MAKPSKDGPTLKERILGMGEVSARKSYYPELQRKLDDLARSEHRYRVLVDHLPIGVALVGLDHRVTMANAPFLDMMNRSEDAVVGTSIDALLPTVWDATGAGNSSSAERDAYRFEYSPAQSGGRILEVAVHPLGEGVTAADCCIVVVRDVSLERQTIDSQKAQLIATMTSGVAHDFNNILTSLVGFTDLALLDAEEGSDLASDLREVSLALKRATDLVAQLLTISRRTSPRRHPLHLGKLIEEVTRLVRASLSASISIETEIETEDDTVVGDPSQLHQVLTNLCINAGQAMTPRGGTLRVRLTHHDPSPFGESPQEWQQLTQRPHLVVEVTDEGSGIDPRIADQIFEPYFTTKEPGTGTGLGLAVVRSVIQAHDGTINVDTLPGRGTTFRVCLPATTTERAPSVPSPASIPSGWGTVLFVDDEPSLIVVARRALTRANYQVIAASDGAEAIQILSQGAAVDVLVTDKTMPTMSGFELVRAIRRSNPRLPVLLCTGHEMAGDSSRCAELGISRILRKPFGAGELVHAVAEVMKSASPTSGPA